MEHTITDEDDEIFADGDENTLVVTLGGTIESFYNPEEGTPDKVPLAPRAEDTCIPKALERLGLHWGCDVYPLAMKDSKDLRSASLDHLLEYVAESNYKRVVIVQGTDTMPTNARLLKSRIAEYGSLMDMDQKTFIFTGSMYPLRDKDKNWRSGSDGWANLSHAMDRTRDFAGVAVEIEGKRWEADTIDKEREVKDKWVTRSGFKADDPARHKSWGI